VCRPASLRACAPDRVLLIISPFGDSPNGETRVNGAAAADCADRSAESGPAPVHEAVRSVWERRPPIPATAAQSHAASSVINTADIPTF